MTSMITREAIAIAQTGVWVFPCRPDKRPYTRNGFHDASADPGTVERLFAQYGDNCTIAMPTGVRNRVFVVDLDLKPGIDGTESLRALEDRHGLLPETRTVLTPSGGTHLYFKHPGRQFKIKTNAGQLGIGIDIRGDGGYVIIPPSDGYEYEASTTMEAAEAPQWLLDLVIDRSNGSASQGNGSESIKPSEITDISWLNGNGTKVAQWVENILTGSPLHDSLRSLAAHLRATGTTEPAAIQILQVLMNQSAAKQIRYDEWAERRADIGRLVRSAEQFTKPEPPPDTREAGEYRLIWAKDAQPRLAQPTLIRGLIGPESMIVTYGASNSGKTFHVLDRDMHLAAGRTWYDRETEPGFVLYVAAEGPHSIERRVHTFMQERFKGVRMPFAILPFSLNLLHPDADTQGLIDFIKSVEDRIGMGCVKITADTLARVIAGGNENSPEDMGALVKNADRVRIECKTAFEFIHHSGKDEARGARGHSSLRAATDTEIEVTNKDGYHIATVTKQRDFQTGDEFAFQLPVVELGEDKYGHPITTCVPSWVLDHSAEPAGSRLSKQESTLLQFVKKSLSHRKTFLPSEVQKHSGKPYKAGQFAVETSVLKEAVNRAGGLSTSDNPDTQRRTFLRTLQSLRNKGKLEVYDDWVWLADMSGHERTFLKCPARTGAEGPDGRGHPPLGGVRRVRVRQSGAEQMENTK